MNPGKKELLIVGLGNPGKEYAATRHNVGFLAADELARCWGFGRFQSKWQAEVVSNVVESCRIHLIKPQTYMNRSGFAVSQFFRFYKAGPERMLVVHDDLDMHVGRIKLVRGGGDGGHNGIKSICEHLGTKDFFRLKVGIGRPGRGGVHEDFPVEKYVLSNFARDELDLLDERFVQVERGLRLFITDGFAKAMNIINGLK
jgi:PTH1 family peptidyl-tRNA hydrolase